MNIREIKKPITAAMLNESLAQKYGTKIKLESFTLEQLEDARNKLRTQLRDIETNESFNSVQSEAYQKSKLFLDVLNKAISEAEKKAAKDYDEDGKIETPSQEYKGSKDKAIKKAMGKEAEKKNESVIKEGEEDKAELVMAAKDMVDRVTGWMEDTAEMQTESMLELADAIRDEMGSEASEAFTAQVKPALEAMYTAMESTRQSLTAGVGQLTGEAEPATDMGADVDAEAGAEEDPAMEPTVDQEAGAEEPADDFSADAAAAGGEEPLGRETRESVERSRRLGTVLSKKK
jgi:hypothetical protein